MDLKHFKKKHHIKGGGPGGDLNGPTLKNLMNNKNKQLDELGNILRENYDNLCLFTDHLKHLAHLNSIVNSKELDLELVKETLHDIRNNFLNL